MNRKENGNEFSLLIMMAFFILSFLLLVVFSTGVYRSIALSQEQSSLSRTLSSYLHTASTANEAGIYYEQKEGKTVLVIRDELEGFGNRIYLSEGYLVEDYGRLEDKLHTQSATKIAANQTFLIEEVNEELLKITTDDGEVFISRMGGGQ